MLGDSTCLNQSSEPSLRDKGHDSLIRVDEVFFRWFVQFFIHNPGVVDRILSHLGLPLPQDRSPPLPATSPASLIYEPFLEDGLIP